MTKNSWNLNPVKFYWLWPGVSTINNLDIKINQVINSYNLTYISKNEFISPGNLELG